MTQPMSDDVRATIRLALEYKKASILYLPHSLSHDEAAKMTDEIDAALAWITQQAAQPATAQESSEVNDG